MPHSAYQTNGDHPHYEAKQYNALAPKYQIIKRLPTTYVETANIRAAAAPYVTNARVLDLACGTGYYSHKLLEWGAASVVGVDISEGMVAVAEESVTRTQATLGKLKFHVGDARALGVVEGGGYDLVTSVWLLNYATNTAELQAMFEGIAENLKPGGVFAGLTTPPVPAAEMDAHKAFSDDIRARKAETLGIDANYKEWLESGGWRVEVSTKGRFGEDGVTFTTLHLPMEEYETAAREGGMKGRFEWREVKLEGKEREEAEQDAGKELFREYFGSLGPHFGILVVEKEAL